MTEETANLIFDVLMDNVDAYAEDRADFVFYMLQDCRHEWRFQGNLGFGGKTYIESDRWRVNCYQEDETPERAKIIKTTNEKLKELFDANASNGAV